MAETQLFVYGTLRHDQPEHARFCRGLTGWEPARVRGQLTRISEGYLLLVVPDSAVLLRASTDAAADEVKRAKIDQAALAPGYGAGDAGSCDWIEGELLTFADAAVAWPPLDEWEGFTPDGDAVYQRSVIPVSVGGAMTAAWAYVTTELPRQK